jgi:hypothetical protein
MQENDLEGLPLTVEEVQALMEIDNKMLFNWLVGEMKNFHNRAHNDPEQAGSIRMKEIIKSESAENFARGIGAWDDLKEAREKS